MNIAETWKPVVGYEGLYEVSSRGRVRSVTRTVIGNSRWGKPRKMRFKGTMIRCQVDRNGYVSVMVSRRGRTKRLLVHRLVARAFIPNPGGKPEVNHIDGSKENNTTENLEWATRSENSSHSYKSGLRETGKDHHFSRLPRNSQGFCISEAD